MEDPTNHNRIMDFEESQRPRERLERSGPEALSNAELLAILLRVGKKGLMPFKLVNKRCGSMGDC